MNDVKAVLKSSKTTLIRPSRNADKAFAMRFVYNAVADGKEHLHVVNVDASKLAAVPKSDLTGGLPRKRAH
eukprot:6199681-Pleurochrysis_carterae.AAC.2